MRGHDDQAGGLQPEHQNGQSPRRRSRGRTTAGDGSPPLTRAVVRRVDARSVLKVSIVFYLAVYCILLVAAVLLWLAATATGLRDNIEQVVADLIASGKFHFVGSELLQAGAVGGALLVVFGTAANVMLAVLYNLITDLVGGVSLVVTEPRVKHPRRSRKQAPRPAPRSAGEVAPRPATEPARRPVTEPVSASTTESPRILIPEGERGQALQQPLPAPAQHPEAPAEQPVPERPFERDAAPERPWDRGGKRDPNLEAFGL